MLGTCGCAKVAQEHSMKKVALMTTQGFAVMMRSSTGDLDRMNTETKPATFGNMGC
jgi:hypothetical protein